MRISAFIVAGAVVLTAGLAHAEEHGSKIASTPQWERMKTLVGEWDGYAVEEGKKLPTHVSVRMTGDGSAVMHWMDAGTPHEMITMFHLDGSDLLATHYCAAHNQPRMKMVQGSDPNVLVFEFKDGTNIGPDDVHMQSVTITFIDADHHYEDWSSIDHGKIETMRFDFHRKKA